MIDLHDVSVITSATIDSPDRLRNTHLFLRYFETFCTNYEIIIVEHDTESQLAELTRDRPGVLLHFVESENCHSRSKNLNRAAVLTDRRVLLVCDLDVFIPPSSLEKGLDMVRNGVDFVFPYNGLLIQIKAGVIDKDMDLHGLMDRLVFFNMLHQIRPPKYDHEVFEVIYGSVQSQAFGGITICNRRKFFLAGAMNENLHSFGCEDLEFFHRIRKLGYQIERLDGNNAYHFEHFRSADSVRNNFHNSNLTELERVKAMEPSALRRYANNGYQEIKLDTRYGVTVTNTPTEYAIKLAHLDRIRLPNPSLILVFENSLKEDMDEFERFFDYMETNFDNYSIQVVEGEFAKFRLANARKFTRHIWLKIPLTGVTDDELKKLDYTNGSTIEIYRFADKFEPSRITDRYNRAKFQTGVHEDIAR